MAGKFKPGDIVWAKCGALFWPAEMVDFQKLPADIKDDFAAGKEPQFVVKFFDEDGYEFLKNDKNLHPYNCEKKEDFIKKGIVKSRTKSKEGSKGYFSKFPEDVVKCETLTGGDPKLLEKEPYLEKNERIDYSQYFGDQSEKQKSTKRKSGPATSGSTSTPSPKKRKSSPQRPISHPRFKPGGEQHQVRIMQQPSTPVHLDLLKKEENKQNTPKGAYTCHLCGNSASRLNVIIMCTKSCKEKMNSTPKASPKKSAKSTPTPSKSNKATPKTPKTPKTDKKTTEKSPAPSAGRGRGRGRPKKAETPAEVATPKATKEKKPRMSKKKKDEMAKEQEKKLEERKKILGEWDEEEDGEAEAEEKKKMKESISASDGSDVESDQEAYFQDDNIQGNIYDDDDDEELFEDEKDKKAKEESTEGEKAGESAAQEKSEEENTESTDTSKNDEVNRLLEETKVPELPDINTELPEISSVKKSVKFSENVAKEFAMTKMALVQPKSNMAGPMEVEDEFMEFEEAAPVAAKTILKRKSSSPPPPPRTATPPVEPEDEPDVENVTSTSANEEQVSSSVESEAVTTSEVDENPEASTTVENVSEASEMTSESAEGASESAEVISESAEMTSEATQASETPVQKEIEADQSSEASSAVAAEAMLALQQQNPEPASTEAKKDEATYMLVMDDSMNPNQLDEQTFYIDSNTLSNGNLVLHTEATPMATPSSQPQQATNGHAHQENGQNN